MSPHRHLRHAHSVPGASLSGPRVTIQGTERHANSQMSPQRPQSVAGTWFAACRASRTATSNGLERASPPSHESADGDPLHADGRRRGSHFQVVANSSPSSLTSSSSRPSSKRVATRPRRWPSSSAADGPPGARLLDEIAVVGRQGYPVADARADPIHVRRPRCQEASAS
jgi:hypothetical protein